MTEADPGFEELLAYLKEVRGFDFTGYKRSTLIRRVQRRMADVGDSSYADYRDRLELHAEEFTALFDTILINVTSFLRDPESWDYLRSDIVPELLAQRPTGPLRIWSAGCATGQEAYSLAIVLAEAMGWDQFRERVKIYATDVDEKALATARQASYSHRELHGLTPDLLERYFEPSGQRWSFRKDLRRAIIFGRNDLVQDAPISHVDLLLCRNTLMYFTAETQARIVQRLHFALNPAGALFLGKAEMLLSHGSLFTAVDLPRRFFRKVAVRPLDRVPVTATMTLRPAPEPTDPEVQRLREALMASSSAQLVLDASARVTLINRRADALFSLSARDVGRLFQDLEVSYRPVELRSAVQEAHTQRRAVLLRDVEWRRGTELLWLDIQVVPLLESDGRVVGTSLNFTDVSRSRQLREELEYANRQLETAYEELQSTNEELETTNEELQSTVEELETTNEELQSTNEELETMNEELQSMNDELQSTNDQLRERTSEVDELNAFMSSVFAGLRAGVVVVNSDLLVQVWNDQAEEQWGVRQDEAAGRHLLTLDIGLPLEQVRPLVRSLLSGEQQEAIGVIPAVNRRGRPVVVHVTGTPLRYGEVVRGAILVMQTQEDREPVDRAG
ncbi:MAG TPA: CheR family methyltransferase [Actinomycetales bacterium]|nr:CheR family methyltransferase [Actinomycetales bacterium]